MHQDSPESDSSPTTQSSYRDSLLKSNSENFKLFIEECGDPFFVHDIHGNILEVNRTACESLGYTRSELLSLNVKDIETGFSLEALDRLWSSLISGEIFDLDGEHTRKDGTKFPVEVRFSKMPGEGLLRKKRTGSTAQASERKFDARSRSRKRAYRAAHHESHPHQHSRRI
jgi:PAS domain S-box-containing protein